jgi:hypothetical protein
MSCRGNNKAAACSLLIEISQTAAENDDKNELPTMLRN